MINAYRRLLAGCIVLAVLVIGLGAYVRLSDAGLGCPDWPGCYGQLLGVPDTAADPVRAGKEMLHRYLAGSLGIAIFVLCALSWRLRPKLSPVLPTALAGIVIGQAALGMWTVTLRLEPLVVTAHLLGGMTTLALLVWLQWQQLPVAAQPARRTMQVWAGLALLAVSGQIALGGWVSSHYAGLACGVSWRCPEFLPLFGGWLTTPPVIHGLHRLGALAVLMVIGSLAWQLRREAPQRRRGILLLLVALAVQIALGIANVLLALPLPLAVAHNLGAALVLALLVGLNFHLAQPCTEPA